MNRIRFTKDGLAKLQADYDELLAQRPGAVEDLKKARELGDLKENGYYHASRRKLSFIDSQIRQFGRQLKLAKVVDDAPKNIVAIGNTVYITDGEKELTYHIVGDFEANPSEKKISLFSPLGKALANKMVGDTVTVMLPKGEKVYTITTIK